MPAAVFFVFVFFFPTIPSTQQVLGGSSRISSESYTDSNLQSIIMIIDTVQRVEPVFTGRAPRQMNTHTRGHMTAQTAAGSGTEEETHAAAGVGPAQAAETRCASKPASAAAWAESGAAIGQRGWAWSEAGAGPAAAGGGRSGARGCARLRLEFQYKQGPRLDRRVFSFLPAFGPSWSCVRLWGRRRTAARRRRPGPCAGRCSGVPAAGWREPGWREPAARSPGAA